ncbi:hypothetical protein E2C01_073421 [Portunus trituberculatus]|uniref:Uncharacterized protein n=1 Tax=Portunus trituberculatus TaxID=210409 RepID=A0A5B7IDW6_PORTR|nr:hypothetical protein [Portunus trituberculatus]
MVEEEDEKHRVSGAKQDWGTATGGMEGVGDETRIEVDDEEVGLLNRQSGSQGQCQGRQGCQVDEEQQTPEPL